MFRYQTRGGNSPATRVLRNGLISASVLFSSSAAAETLLLMMDSGPFDEPRMEIIAEHIKGHGLKVQIASASLEDSALLLGCEAEEDSCLSQIAIAGKADSILVLPSGSGRFVALRNEQRRSEPYPMAQDNEAGWLAAVSAVLGVSTGDDIVVNDVQSDSVPGEESVGADASEGVDPSRTEKSSDGGSLVQGNTNGTGFTIGRIRRRTWFVLGGGAAAAGLGLVFARVASSKQDQVDSHPTNTVADLEDLRALESSGKNFTLASNLALVGGSLAILGGVGLAFFDQKKDAAPKQSSLTIYPALSGDGVGINLVWGDL